MIPLPSYRFRLHFDTPRVYALGRKRCGVVAGINVSNDKSVGLFGDGLRLGCRVNPAPRVAAELLCTLYISVVPRNMPRTILGDLKRPRLP